MKKICLYVCLLIVAGTMFSCNDWLEVDSDSQVVQEDLFSTGDGFRTALNGVYRLLGQEALYAKELNWGLLSVLGQNYESSRLPDAYRMLSEGYYDEDQSLDVIDPIWSQGFKLIANCNNLIQNTMAKDTSFFAEGKIEKDLILGECFGLRAMMHLDLLRLFAPAPVADDGMAYMPYITRYPETQPLYLPVSQVLDSIIRDLEYAKQTLVYHDTLYNIDAMSSVGSRMEGGDNSLVKGGLFFHFRGTRMNYFSASALLARAYLYKGDKENAYRCAFDVYEFNKRRRWFSFTSSSNLSPSDNNVIYRKMYEDILLAAVNNNLYDLYMVTSDNTFFYFKNVDNLFGADLDDFRKTKLIETDNSSRRWSQPGGNQESYQIKNIVRYQGPLAPIIRLSEVYYIMCECLSDTDLRTAVDLLEGVRLARGAKTPLSESLTKEQFLEVLYNEIIRESMSEGQSFFMHKRLNRPMYNGEFTIDMTDRYVLPIPYEESAYMNL